MLFQYGEFLGENKEEIRCVVRKVDIKQIVSDIKKRYKWEICKKEIPFFVTLWSDDFNCSHYDTTRKKS